jgi:hypothetical protein
MNNSEQWRGRQLFLDDGYSSATLVRPALERLRDAAAGVIDRILRQYAKRVVFQIYTLPLYMPCGGLLLKESERRSFLCFVPAVTPTRSKGGKTKVHI